MDTKKLNLYMSILKVGLAAIGAILCLFLFGGVSTEAPIAEQEAFRDGTSLGLAVSFTGFIIFASVGLILLFFVVQLITNPKKTVMSIIGLLAALVLYLIFTIMGTSDTNESLALIRNPVDLGTIASTTAGLYTVLTGVIVAFLAVILGPFLGRYRK
jgi:uncharacterized membrane protein